MPIAIHTKALPATDTLPGRIKATAVRGRTTVSVIVGRGSFDDDDHRAAAQALADKYWPEQPMTHAGATLDGRGDVYTIGAIAC